MNESESESESEESKQNQMIEEEGERAGNRRDRKEDLWVGDRIEIIALDRDDGEGGRRCHRYRFKDDQLLISAWLKISKDPVVGNDQKVDSFWNRMAEYFNEHRKGVGARTSNQLRQHWHKLNRAVMQFVGYYSQVCQRHKGRMSEEDIINRARQMYEEEIGKKFVLEHAWRLLNDEPKWRACHDTSGNSCSSCKRMKVSESGAYTSSSNLDMNTPGDFGVSEACEVRPIDGKAVKRKVKEKLQEESETDFQASFGELKSLEKERNSAIMHFSWVKEKEIELKEKEIEVKQKEIEIKILLADTASMSPLQREIHEEMLKEILKKYK